MLVKYKPCSHFKAKITVYYEVYKICRNEMYDSNITKERENESILLQDSY